MIYNYVHDIFCCLKCVQIKLTKFPRHSLDVQQEGGHPSSLSLPPSSEARVRDPVITRDQWVGVVFHAGQ